LANIEVLNVNVDLMATSYDDDSVNEMALGSNEVSRPMVGSISTPSTPTPSKVLQPQTLQTQKQSLHWNC
jgi:hypothetical protein